MPTPVPTRPPYVAPGTPTVPLAALHPRIQSLAADPSSWNAADAEGGWINRGDAILVPAESSGAYADILETVSIGSSMREAVDAIGRPYQRDELSSIFFFDGCVLVLYGRDTILAAAFRGIDVPGKAGVAAGELCRSLYEYRRLFLDEDGTAVPSADKRLLLSYFEGEKPFFAVYPAGDRTRWIPLYGSSREYYWVNAHTFLSIDAETLVPACHSFDINAVYPAERIRTYPLVDIQSVDSEIRIDMKYASEDNFVKTNLYGDFTTVFMPPEVAEQLANAHKVLQAEYPELRFLVYDSYRPISAQQKMWDIVQGTEFEAILSNPKTWFSDHYIGLAVDLTLYDTRTGRELDLGTPFDSFDPLARPDREPEYLANGRLTADQYTNRLILRNAMESQGFSQLYFEWWQFNLWLGGIPNMYHWFE